MTMDGSVPQLVLLGRPTGRLLWVLSRPNTTHRSGALGCVEGVSEAWLLLLPEVVELLPRLDDETRERRHDPFAEVHQVQELHLALKGYKR